MNSTLGKPPWMEPGNFRIITTSTQPSLSKSPMAKSFSMLSLRTREVLATRRDEVSLTMLSHGAWAEAVAVNSRAAAVRVAGFQARDMQCSFEDSRQGVRGMPGREAERMGDTGAGYSG